jgi:hypothetical protein
LAPAVNIANSVNCSDPEPFATMAAASAKKRPTGLRPSDSVGRTKWSAKSVEAQTTVTHVEPGLRASVTSALTEDCVPVPLELTRVTTKATASGINQVLLMQLSFHVSVSLQSRAGAFRKFEFTFGGRNSVRHMFGFIYTWPKNIASISKQARTKNLSIAASTIFGLPLSIVNIHISLHVFSF